MDPSINILILLAVIVLTTIQSIWRTITAPFTRSRRIRDIWAEYALLLILLCGLIAFNFI